MSLAVQLFNRSGTDVDEAAAASLARDVLVGEGIEGGELGIPFVAPQEIRALKRDHLGFDEETDVLAFPIDGAADVAADLPRLLGDVILCPQVVGQAWREPLVHGLLHLLGYLHGDEMRTRERAYV
jgi:rRNA maturation RNase YbeY